MATVHDNWINHPLGYQNTISYVLVCVLLVSGVMAGPNITVDEGKAVELRCDESDHVSLEDPSPINDFLTSWFKLSDTLPQQNATLIARHIGSRNVYISEDYEGRGLELNLGNGRLTIPSVEVRDEGVYRCEGALRNPEETELIVRSSGVTYGVVGGVQAATGLVAVVIAVLVNEGAITL